MKINYFQAYALIKFTVCILVATVLTQYFTVADNIRYLDAPTAWGPGWYYSSTSLMDTLSSILNITMGKFANNIVFCALSLVGVYSVYKSLRLSTKEANLFFLFLLSPSFLIWTSSTSKEAFITLVLGLLFSIFLNVKVNPSKPIPKFGTIFLLYLLVIFKAHYLPSVFFLFLYCYDLRSKSAIIFTYTFLFLFTAYAVLMALPFINEMASIIPSHFSGGNVTRENIFWLNDNDVIIFAFKGSIMAFWGPMFSEINGNVANGIVWFESLIVVTVISLMLIFSFKRSVFKTGYFRLNSFSIIIAILLLLLAHYPFGLFNFGSGLRYRSGFFLYFIGLVFLLYKKDYIKQPSFS